MTEKENVLNRITRFSICTMRLNSSGQTTDASNRLAELLCNRIHINSGVFASARVGTYAFIIIICIACLDGNESSLFSALPYFPYYTVCSACLVEMCLRLSFLLGLLPLLLLLYLLAYAYDQHDCRFQWICRHRWIKSDSENLIFRKSDVS